MKNIFVKSLLGALAAGAFALAAAPVVAAQAHDQPYYASQGEVIIRAPRQYPEVGPLGGEVRTVYTERAVPYGDLDLRTHRGADRLRARVRSAVFAACGDLDARYPVPAPESRPCEPAAMRRGLREANFVIRAARGY